MMSDDDEAFEDAMEDVTPRVEPALTRPDLPPELRLDMARTAQPPPFSPVQLSSKPFIQTPEKMSPVFSHPVPVTPVTPVTLMPLTDLSTSARHERLAALRRRMRDEFGQSRAQPSTADSDLASLASESASMHSWHHNLLGLHTPSTVRPLDTMSTYAASDCLSGQLTSAPSVTSSSDCHSASGQVSYAPSARSSSDGHSNSGQLSPCVAPCISPPPAMPPPPRPAPRTTAPPPLPPRNPSIRLPDPVAAEVMARIAAAERSQRMENLVEDEEDGICSTPPSALAEEQGKETSPRNGCAPSQTGASSSTTLDGIHKNSQSSEDSLQVRASDAATSGVSICLASAHSASSSSSARGDSLLGLPSSSGERRGKGRGHVKTNSLDRGLTLAKSIKTGPFPPPASKTNSLTRQQQTPGESDGEEEERNTLAVRVIQQLTTFVIGEDSSVNVECSLEKGERPKQLGPIPSCSSSEASSSTKSSKELARKRKQKLRETDEGIEKREMAVDVDERVLKTLSVLNESPEHGSIQHGSIHGGQEGKTKKKSGSLPLHSRPPISPDRFSRNHTEDNYSFDPITRDVERRMSMKGHGILSGEDVQSEDGRSDAAVSTAASSLIHAKAAVREYGSAAGGFIRGVFTRAKSVLHTGSASRAAGEMEFTASEESDSEMQSMADTTAGGSTVVAGAQGIGKTWSGGLLNTQIVRPRNTKKGPFDFEHLRVVQELNNEHTGAVWCVKFSVCGRLLATAGQDSIIRVWCARNHSKYFGDWRDRYQQKRGSVASSGLSSDVFDKTMAELESEAATSFRPPSSDAGESLSDTMNPGASSGNSPGEDEMSLFAAKPFALFKGHTSDVLDLSWSKNFFILTSGMDRTVKLWHLSRSECLCCFQHIDFVTCVAFLPKDDRYFLSGSLDGKLRLWHIPEKRVAVWNEVQVKFITALTFAKGGKFAVVGTYNGRCYFYTTDQLKYHTVVDVRSTRGKNARGHKVTGLAVHGDKLLVTSNDSRIRMYDVRDKALTCKFKGAQTEKCQIRATFSPDGKHIVCGSEDRFVYIWRTSELPSSLSVRKDRNAQWERARAHTAPVTVACFAPRPGIFLSLLERIESRRRGREESTTEEYRAKWQEQCSQSMASVSGSQPSQLQGDIIVSADLSGCIKVMVNRTKATKTGQSTFFSTPREI